MTIAYSATSGGSGSGTSVTYSHTCSGSDRILFVSAFAPYPASGSTTGVTYGGVSMTKVDSNKPQANWDYSLWYLVNPASGANNVVCTSSNTVSGSFYMSMAVSYTGASQTGQPDGSAKANGSGTTLNQSVTTTADNSWVIGAGMSGAGSPTASTGVTSRNSQTFCRIGDSNAPKTPAGSYSMTYTTGSSDNWGLLMASFSPAGGTSTQISAVNGVAQASISSFNGVALASVASVMGVANS